MSEFSKLTRRQQVLRRLEQSKGEWVNGSEISNASVGGSEGRRRTRELRAEGYTIEMRPHPNPDYHDYQYRLIDRPPVTPRGAPTRERAQDPAPQPTGPHYDQPPKRLVFGQTVPCNRCHGSGKDPYRTPKECFRCHGIGYLPWPG